MAEWIKQCWSTSALQDWEVVGYNKGIVATFYRQLYAKSSVRTISAITPPNVVWNQYAAKIRMQSSLGIEKT